MDSDLPSIATLILNHDSIAGLNYNPDEENNQPDIHMMDPLQIEESQNYNGDKVNDSFTTAIDQLSDVSSESKQNCKENLEDIENVSLKQGDKKCQDDVALKSNQNEIAADQLNNLNIHPEKSNRDNVTKISVVQDPNLIISTPRAKIDTRSLHERDLKSNKPRQVNVNVSSGFSSGSRSSRHSSTADVQTIGKYRLLKTIGKGNFARVKLAIHIPTNRHVAIKMIDKTQLNASGLQKLFREVRIMKALEHPNIVKLYEVIETERILYLVMEYASRGEIFDFLVTNGRMKEKDVRSKFRQILSAVQYCHRKRIVHRDLKAENLLLDSDLNIKLADFGFSNEYSPGNLLDTFCGSPPYAAPELFQGKKYEGPEVDVWSLGVILYTLVSGSLPFDGRNLRELREKIIKGKYRVPFYMTSDCEALLKRFLIINPKKRLTLENAMKDNWLNVGYELDRLEPYVEPPASIDDTRVDALIKMGYKESEVKEAVTQRKYNDIGATYHLLGLKQSALNDVKLLSSSSRFSSTPQKSRPIVTTPGKALSSTIRTDNARTSFSAGPTTKSSRVSRNVSVNVTSTPTQSSRDSSMNRGFPVRVMQSSTAYSSIADERRRSSATASNSNNGAISKNIVIQKLGPARLSQREPNKSTYNELKIKSTSTRLKSCTSMESTDMESNLLSCFPERHHRAQGCSLSQHQDSTSLYPCNADLPYVIGTDKPREAFVPSNDSDLADGLLTVKVTQSRQKSPPSSPIEADLADPTSPWSSAACTTPFYRRASDGKVSVALSTRPPSSQSPITRPPSRHKTSRSTVHGSISTGASNNAALPSSTGRGGRFSIDSQTSTGDRGPLSPDSANDGRRFSLFTRITARFNKK